MSSGMQEGVGFEVISIATSQTSGVPPQSAIWIQSNPCCLSDAATAFRAAMAGGSLHRDANTKGASPGMLRTGRADAASALVSDELMSKTHDVQDLPENYRVERNRARAKAWHGEKLLSRTRHSDPEDDGKGEDRSHQLPLTQTVKY
jgi:hypothetical protein